MPIERDAVEVVISQQWGKVLGTRPASLDANFFECGGTSLAAAALTGSLRQALGCKLTLNSVFENPTVRGLGKLVRAAAADSAVPATSRLIAIKESGEGVPLVIAPAVGGGVNTLGHLGDERFRRPVFALLSRGLSAADGVALTSTEEIAEDFADVLEAQLPVGAVHLGGFCAGAHLAWQLSAELTRRGWQVVSLAMFNAPPLGGAQPTLETVVNDRLREVAQNAGVGELSAEAPFASLFRALGGVWDIVEETAADFEARTRVYAANTFAVSRFSPVPLDAPVAFYSTPDRLDGLDTEAAEPMRDWGSWGVGRLATFDVPVTHWEMLQHGPTLTHLEDWIVAAERAGLAVSNEDLPRLGVVYAPKGAATLPEIYLAAEGVCEIALIVEAETAAVTPDLCTVASKLFGNVIVLDGDAGSALRGLSLDGLTTFNDHLLDLVDQAEQDLGLAGSTQTRNPWDKLTQRHLLVDAGVSKVWAVGVDSAEDFARAVEEVGFPGVLKPRRGVGGGGVSFIDSVVEFDRVLAARLCWDGLLYEQRIAPGSHPSGVSWLADFVSVETVSTGQGRQHVAVFDKTPVAVAAGQGSDGSDVVSTTGDVIPSRLPAEDLAAVVACVDQALDALDVTWRVTHTEVHVCAAGVDVIEVNGRVGGHLTRLLRLVGGPDLVRLALLAALRTEPEPVTGPLSGAAAGLFPAFPQCSGAVLSRVRRSDLRQLSGVVGVDDLAVAGTSRADTGFRAANLTLKASGTAELDSSVQMTCRRIAELFAEDGLAQGPWPAQVISGS
ncbi:thioesterase domain-containing protein [Streptomyces sp. NPDC047042]|uniref:thioesterase domain-containing protein n=1 Tax=Streptomyces sp. NPDC047042 TaxID=3154807 RepID=UPI0033E6B77E